MTGRLRGQDSILVTGATPIGKVNAAGLAGAVAVILTWGARLIGLEVPPEVAAAATTVLAFGAGYLKR